jgi:hypothetical protein
MADSDRTRYSPRLPELLLIGAAVVAVRLWFLAFTHVTYEDALISLRYAENLAAGRGLVYNPGEHVFGATTPLHVLLLAALSALHLHEPLFAAKLLSILADGLTAAIWYRLIARETASRAGALVFAAAFGLSPLIVEISASGMETPLVLLCLTLAFEAVYARRGLVLGLWLGLLLLLRLDAALFAIILLVARARREGRFPLRETAVTAAVVAPWLLFSLLYYGSIIPNSIPAKLNAYNAHMHSMSRQFWYTFSHLTPFRISVRATWAGLSARETLFAILYLPLFLLGVAVALRHRVWGVVLLCFLGHWAFLVLPRTLIFPWYLPPLLLPYYILGGIGFVRLRQWHASTATRPALQRAFGLVFVGGLVLHTGHWLTTAGYRRWAVQSYEDTVRKPIGLWLARNTPPDAVVSVEPIGYIGYYSNRKILDEVGLVSPEVIPFNRRGAGWFTAVVRTFHPDYIVERPHFLMANKTLNTGVPMFASPAERDWFWANYRRVRDFPCSGSRSFRSAYTFVILKRLGAGDHARETADGSKATHHRAVAAGSG